MGHWNFGPLIFLRKINAGNDLLSQRVAPQVPSAQEDLTSVFGMGTGVAPPLLSPAILSSALRLKFKDKKILLFENFIEGKTILTYLIRHQNVGGLFRRG